LKKALNIAVNARTLLPGVKEGIPRYIHETTSRLVLNNPQHAFYFFFDRPFDQKYVYADNVKPIVVSPQARHPILWKVWFDFQLPRYFDKYNIDVFYSGESYLSMKTDVPTLMVTHDLAYEHFSDQLPKSQVNYYRKNSKRFHNRANHIIAVSNFTKEDIIKMYNMSRDGITVAGNACPPGFTQIDKDQKKEIQRKYTDGNPYFMYLGSIHPRKNVESLLKAFDVFKQNDTGNHKLFIVGRLAWNTTKFITALENHTYKADIIHLENVGQEVNTILAGAEALVYISLFEGFGIPILEAMSCSIPVITSIDSSMSEISDGAAIEVNPTDINAISKAMHQLVEKPKLREELILKGKERVKFYSWDRSVKIIEKKLLDLGYSKLKNHS